jgi:hypothetical protein
VKVLRFGVLTTADYPSCEPLAELKSLLRRGLMPRTCVLFGKLPGGDCSAIARD